MKKLAVVLLAILIGVGGAGLASNEAESGRTVRAAWIFISPIGDFGWSYAHNQGRLYVEALFPWLETIYADKVPPGEVESFIDHLVYEEKVDVIFTTSSGFIIGTTRAAKRHPHVMFFQVADAVLPPLPNRARFFADIYQGKYLCGLMAGALTETNRIGYVATHPIAQLKRHISAFTIGVREVNPDAVVDVRWLFAWYDPVAATAAARALIVAGADVIAFSEDSPTIVGVAAAEGIPVFGHYSPQYRFGPEVVVSGQIANWEVIYADILSKVHHGIFTPENLADVGYWWLLKEGATDVGAKPGMVINPIFADALKARMVTDPVVGEISVYDLVHLRIAQMREERILFDPFDGPIYDRKGVLRVPAGARASRDLLWGMAWAAEGIIGPWPGEE